MTRKIRQKKKTILDDLDEIKDENENKNSKNKPDSRDEIMDEKVYSYEFYNFC